MIREEILSAIAECDHEDAPSIYRMLAGRVGQEKMRELYFETAGTAPANPTIKLMRAGAFIKSIGPIPPMVVEGLIPSRSIILLTGKPKFGKTLLAIDIADAICSGRKVFDHLFINRPGPVIYLGMEDSDIETADRLTRRGLNGDDCRPLFLTPQRFTVSNSDGMDTLHRLFKETTDAEGGREPSLVIIDTARESLGIKEWNDPAEVGDKIRPLREGFAREKCTVMLIGHNRKQVAESEGDEIAGSNAFASSVDGWISDKKMEKMDNGNRRHWLSVVGRSNMNAELVVEMDTASLEFTIVADDELKEEREAQQKKRRFDRLAPALEVIRDAGGCATIQEIATGLGITTEAARLKVNQAVGDGFLEQAGERKAENSAGRPAPVYRQAK